MSMPGWRVYDWFLWLVGILSGLGSASYVVVGLMVLPCSSRGLAGCGPEWTERLSVGVGAHSAGVGGLAQGLGANWATSTVWWMVASCVGIPARRQVGVPSHQNSPCEGCLACVPGAQLQKVPVLPASYVWPVSCLQTAASNGLCVHLTLHSPDPPIHKSLGS